jgi:diguanylate cyclase (GGDEF)-like protein/PAS domain S-box-containing protein
MTLSRTRGLLRRRPTASLPTQAFVLMAVSITIVSAALIWHQGESIKQQVVAERLASVSRQATIFQSHVAAQGIGDDRAAIGRYLQGELDDAMLQLGAIEAVVTDDTGRIVAAADDAQVGQMEPAEEVQLILAGRAGSVARPEKGDEGRDFAFAIPLVFPAFEGALYIEEDIQALNGAIAAATRDAALPAVLMLILVAPLAALIARRILRRTQQSEHERAWQDRFRSLVQNASDVIVVVDGDGAIQFATPVMERVLGHRVAEVQLLPFSDLVHPGDIGTARAAVESASETLGRVVRSEYRVRHADGHWITAEVQAASLLDDPSIRGTVLTIRDVSERKALEAQLTHQALHDSLTGLANRALFNDRLRNAVARGRRGKDRIAVIVLDLDDFKLVNDTHGRDAGDAVLAQVAQRVLARIREGDTAARVGGDEFAVLLEDVTPADVAAISAGILASFDEPVPVGTASLAIQASIGVAHGFHGTIETADVLSCADIAMYAAKDDGKGRLKVFAPGMRMADNERVEVTAELRRAIDERQLEVHYQPIVDIPAGTLRGMEALVRWRHPIRGHVMPSEFIPLAETSGLIVQLGEFVLRQACLQAQAWRHEAGDSERLTMSVNLSAAQLDDDGLMNAVGGALRDSGLPAAALTLEITESVLVRDVEATASRLRELKGLGVGLAIDDFGTGYSSLSYLRRFPVDIIKIDKSFVDGIGTPGPGLALAKSIVRLARNLNLKTVAEGVEHQEQLEVLAAMGCDLAQGYLFSRALDVQAATEYVRQIVTKRAEAGSTVVTTGDSTKLVGSHGRSLVDMIKEAEQPPASRC